MQLRVSEIPRSGRVMGLAGFALSAITNLACISLLGAAVALGTYPASVALRAASWISVGRALDKRLLKATGLAVAILGAVFYLTLITNVEKVRSFELGVLSFLVLLWSIYSLLEAASYLSLRAASRAFLPALLSVPGLALAWPTLQELSATWPYVLLLLLMSAITACVGFARLKPGPGTFRPLQPVWA